MDSATWCRTPAAASAARRLRPEVSKNSSTAFSSNEGELARSITTCAPATASLTPSPVMVLTPLLGEGARTSWPPWRRIATVFEPIRPVPPIMTIFMVASLSMTQSCSPAVKSCTRGFPQQRRPYKLLISGARYAAEGFVTSLCDHDDRRVTKPVGLVQLKSATLRIFAVRASYQ